MHRTIVGTAADGGQSVVRRVGLWSLMMCLFAAGAAGLLAQTAAAKKHRRAKLPDFRDESSSRIFFDDVFSRLVGQRPSRLAASPSATINADAKPVTAAGSPAETASWLRVISSTTLEDEVKSLKLDVDRVVTTPGDFAGRGHKVARVDFSLLSVLFAIIAEYDGDVRWKESAAAARYRFSRTAANLKAGGAIQVYNESKQRKQDLDDLIRGSRLPAAADDAAGWDGLVDRTPLMQLLESRFESNLKQWTASKAEFRANRDDVRHEAELTAALGRALVQPGMDDAEESEYRALPTCWNAARLGS